MIVAAGALLVAPAFLPQRKHIGTKAVADNGDAIEKSGHARGGRKSSPGHLEMATLSLTVEISRLVIRRVTTVVI